MRPQVRRMAGAGNKFVPVTATNLYIHGQSGFVVDVLNCGANIILSSNPDSCPTKTTPIAENFEFDIIAPPRPNPAATLVTEVNLGPNNTVGIAPILETRSDANAPAVHVKIPLAGTAVSSTDVYARKVYVGWNTPPNKPVRHFRLTLNQMDLHDDKETDPGDCKCTFFWMNVDRAPNPWIRLVDFARGDMNDYDDDDGFGDGEMDFSGAVFDFYVFDGDSFSVRANGYDQDCLDDYFGDHRFRRTTFLRCYVAGNGDNDEYKSLEARFGPPSYGIGFQDVTAGNEYELEFKIQQVEIIRQ